MAGDWTQVGENLVRHRGGTIYLRAKVAGKVVRFSLETSDLRIAKIKRDDHLQALRTAAGKKDLAGARTLTDVVDLVAKDLDAPHMKASTRLYYEKLIAILHATLPAKAVARSWGAHDASDWWRKISKKYAAQRANNLLAVIKKVGGKIVECGLQVDNPAAKLKRVPIPKHKMIVPTRGQLEDLIQSIREQVQRFSKESALYVAFLAFSGCRHKEAAAVRWEDVGEDRIAITGGATGTKNREIRHVPISAPLRAVLDELRPKEGKATGLLFQIKTPRKALDNACERLNLPHLRLHDLRHFFATWCIESGIDIPTVAKWLGHKDKGVLAMRTYGHIRDDHSLAAAKKLS